MSQTFTVNEALEIIKSRIQSLHRYQTVLLPDALGKTLAAPIISPIDVPGYRNSAMDGYAFNSRSVINQPLTVAGTAYAGTPYEGVLADNECIRIMTGARVPEQLDVVIEQEKTRVIENRIEFDVEPKSGQNIRNAGEDIQQGSIVLETGARLGPAQLGVLASLGMASIKIQQPLRAAIFSSGDEIRSIGESLEGSQIYDSNRYTITGMLRQLGVDVIDLGVVPDTAETIRQTLADASENADIIITSGGVSVGDADYIRQSLDAMGDTYFSKLHLKPGRPLTFGRINQAHFFGLPGNPVAVMVTFMYFVRPAIKRLLGQFDSELLPVRAISQSKLRKLPGRTEVQRGIFSYDAENGLTVKTSGRQGSGVLSSMNKGNCFIFLEHDRESINIGDEITVHPFSFFN